MDGSEQLVSPWSRDMPLDRVRRNWKIPVQRDKGLTHHTKRIRSCKARPGTELAPPSQ